MFQRKPTEPQFRRTLKLLTNWGVNLDQDALRGAYFGTRVVSREQLAAAVKLLGIFAEHLAILSNQIVIQRDNAEPPMITKAKQFIREHHAEDLSLPRVAQFANASPFHFCKFFKCATGLTFTNFLSRVRIESSKNRLINPQLRVSEIAYEVGFQSLTHFNRVFQRILRQSPTEYRLKVQNGRRLARPGSVSNTVFSTSRSASTSVQPGESHNSGAMVSSPPTCSCAQAGLWV